MSRPFGILVGENLRSLLTDDDINRLRTTNGILESIEPRAPKEHE